MPGGTIQREDLVPARLTSMADVAVAPAAAAGMA